MAHVRTAHQLHALIDHGEIRALQEVCVNVRARLCGDAKKGETKGRPLPNQPKEQVPLEQRLFAKKGRHVEARVGNVAH